MSKEIKLKFRVWHVPQVPCPAFKVEVPSYEEAVRLANALADYDIFQEKHRIKPDFSNMNGIQVYQEDISDQELIEMELDDRWFDIADEDELNEWLDHLKDTGWTIL